MTDQGTRIIIYNLWEDDQGSLELDFDSEIHVCLCPPTDYNLLYFGCCHEYDYATRLGISLP